MSIYIPPELISNILARLAIDDVLRCTIVCKSWYHLITSPCFISSHLKFSTPNQESRLLIRNISNSINENKTGVKEIVDYCVRRDNQTFDQISKLDPPPVTEDIWLIIDTCNGLFCLYDSCFETISLWNPSLRKSIILPKPRVLFDSRGDYKHSIGFGFLSTTNDYKVVRVSYLMLRNGGFKVPPEVDIYELSIGSWRTVNAPEFSYIIPSDTIQAFLNGIVHWNAYDPDKVDRTFSGLIVSFDMKNEKFGALMLPNCLQNESINCRLFSVSTFRESLCVIHNRKNLCNIWVMKEYGVADSWEKPLIIDRGFDHLSRPLYVRENGEILFEKKIANSVLESELVSYNCENNVVKNVGSHATAFMFVDIVAYMESLVLIKGSNEVMGKKKAE